MSKNNKNAKRVQLRKQATAQRAAGGGPAKTTPKHGKKNAWWQKFQSYGAFVVGAKKQKASE